MTTFRKQFRTFIQETLGFGTDNEDFFGKTKATSANATLVGGGLCCNTPAYIKRYRIIF